MEIIKKQLQFSQFTALGSDQSEATIVYAYRLPGDNLWVTTDRVDFPGWEIQAEYAIIHPWLMAGTWEEIRGTFCRMVERDLSESGYPTARNFGDDQRERNIQAVRPVCQTGQGPGRSG